MNGATTTMRRLLAIFSESSELYAYRMNEDTTWARSITHNVIVKQCLEERGWTKQ